MFIDKLMNKFGYSEMYEWSELFKYDIVPFGRFITFAENSFGKIKLANSNDFIIGVTTINSVLTSDDPDEWQGKYICNEYGDCLLQKRTNDIESKYDGNINNIEVVPVINDAFNKDLVYKKRSDRYEWIRVNLLGKCIVTDDGTCVSGCWCTPSDNGKATKCINDLNTYKNKYYVIGRLTENTIMIFFK